MGRRGLFVLLAITVACVVALTPVASGQTTTKGARAATKAKVATGFRPDVLFTPYYVAQDLGYTGTPVWT